MGKGGRTPVVGGVASSSNTNDDAIQQPQPPPKQGPGQTEFFWSTQDEPHAERRKVILQKYPQIKRLYGHDPILKYQVVAVAAFQIGMSIVMMRQPWYIFWMTAYVIGGTCNHMLFMALHELAHNLGFKHSPYNKYFAIFVANVPLGIPAAVSFKRYHMDHHRYQGVHTIDVDIPTPLEGKVINNTVTKLFFVIFQLLFYAIRPTFVNPKPPGRAEIINYITAITFDIALTYCTGSMYPLLYLLLSTLLGGGLHPCAGHFIAEHYVFGTKTPTPKTTSGKDNTEEVLVEAEAETYSYYGPLNYVTFNVGYHNEHHDFPFIPGRRLPEVKRIAAEFYDPLPYHTSWVKVLYNYITMPTVTGFSRVKRMTTSSLGTTSSTPTTTTVASDAAKKEE